MVLQTLKRLIPERHPARLAWHRSKAFAAALRYGFPAKKLTVIGVTGTDGKTTTVGMITHILRSRSYAVGAASTAFMRINDESIENASHLTSIGPFTLQKFLRTLVDRKCTHAVLEMSSHGLVQGRLNHTYPHIAGITNTSHEHLDYHGTMENYRHHKGRMFRMMRGAGTKVLNEADESFAMYDAIPTKETLTFGKPESYLHEVDVKSDAASSSARLIAHGGSTFELNLPIPGMFNLQNAQCAMLCAKAAGIPLVDSVKALQSFRGIPGRMERIDEGQPFAAFVDFAVSPQAYEQTLATLRGATKNGGRTMVLCGSCGNRMKEKRPEIGRICSRLADVTVVTEDETYGEDPHAVLEEVWAGVDQSATDAHKIFDRRTAIEFLIGHAKPGDAIAFCGMGPFSTFTKLEGRIPWDERAIVREIIKKTIARSR